MNRLLQFLLAPHLGVLIRVACACAMGSLVVMTLIVVMPIPLLIVLGMGAAHGLGLLGVLLFAIAVLREAFHDEARQKYLEQFVQQVEQERLTQPPGPPTESTPSPEKGLAGSQSPKED